MKFDFTAFKTSPPSGMRVIKADDECLRLQRIRCGRVFTIRKTEKERFSLFVKSVVDGDSEDGSFVMRTDLPRLLYLVGYGQRPANEVFNDHAG